MCDTHHFKMLIIYARDSIYNSVIDQIWERARAEIERNLFMFWFWCRISISNIAHVESLLFNGSSAINEFRRNLNHLKWCIQRKQN